MLTIITSENPILHKKAGKVKKVDKKLKELTYEMRETLLATRDPVGVGLAAPQVGTPLQIFLMRPTEHTQPITFINPIITHISQEESEKVIQSARIQKAQKEHKLPQKKKLLEGCLSIPSIWGYVVRKKELTLSYEDIEGKKRTKALKGFPAIIAQHEMDHLNGVLFTKRVLEQGEQLYRSYKNEKGEDEFEEIKI